MINSEGQVRSSYRQTEEEEDGLKVYDIYRGRTVNGRDRDVEYGGKVECKRSFCLCSYLVVKHQLWPSVGRRILAQQRPGVGVYVIAVKIALQRLAVPDTGVQVTAQRVDLSPL